MNALKIKLYFHDNDFEIFLYVRAAPTDVLRHCQVEECIFVRRISSQLNSDDDNEYDDNGNEVECQFRTNLPDTMRNFSSFVVLIGVLPPSACVSHDDPMMTTLDCGIEEQ